MKKILKGDQLLAYVTLVFLLIAFAFLLYFFLQKTYVSKSSTSVATEKFSSDKYTLIPKDKLVVYQGNTLPDKASGGPVLDQDNSLPTVDGTSDSARSMFMMAFNQCDPSCCPSTYSCSGGCVCMTKDQVNFVGTRGSNNKGTKCSGPSEI